MTVTIRPSTPADYPAIASITNLTWPDEPTTVAELAQEDENRDPKYKFQRWVAESDQQVVGLSFYFQLPGRYHPRKFWMEFVVLPQYQGQGIGSALYEQLIDGVKQHDPLLARVPLREDMTPCIRFLTKRGLAEEWRSWDLTLNLATFDPTPFDLAGLEDKLHTQGIEIKSYHDLQDDPERDYKLHDVYETTRLDAPFPDAATRLDYESYMAKIAPQKDKDNFFVAVHQGDYVGLSAMKKPRGETVDIHWTGVRREFRGKQIGLALKLRGQQVAKAAGHHYLMTTVNSLNRPMLAINEQLGFTRSMAWVYYTKQLADE